MLDYEALKLFEEVSGVGSPPPTCFLGPFNLFSQDLVLTVSLSETWK